jgi:O-glycosyl hydrolase
VKKTLSRSMLIAVAFMFTTLSCAGTLLGGVAQAEQSTNYVAKASLTLADQSKLLQPQTDIPIVLDAAPNANELSVRVDPTKTYQTMDGVGAAMTESSAYLFSTKLTPQQRGLVFPALFSKSVGAGIDVVRVPWGLNDFSLSEYTYNDNPPGGSDVPQNNFSINHDQQYIMPRLQEAKSVNSNLKLIASPWSAPLWMKASPVPAFPWALGPLNPTHFDSYGTYLTKAVNGYAANSLTPHAFTTQNEPLTLTFNPSMVFSPADQQKLIRDNVGPKIAANPTKPKILAHDEDWQDERDTTSTESALTVLSDPNAAQYIDGIAYHCYHGESTEQLLVQKAHPTKNIYVTECTGSNTPPENWDDDFRWGMRNMIINPARNYARSSIYFNLALDENAGPKTSANYGCQNCRGIMTVTNAGGVAFNNEYFILAHYGKFVDPGAQRIDSTTYGEGAIETVAFKNPNGKKTLIALNSGSQSRNFVVREGNAAFRYTLPAGAAATFTWDMPDNINQDAMDTGRLEAEAYNASSPANLPVLSNLDEGKTAKFVQLGNNEYVRFDNQSLQAIPMSFQMRYGTLLGGTMEFHQNSPTGPLLATIPFSPNNWTTTATVTGTVTPTAGTSSIYAVAKSGISGKVINLNWFKYSQTPASGNPIAGKSTWKAYGFNGGGTDVPANVLDSNNSTRWTGGFPMTLGHWFVVDLGKQTVLDTFGAYSAGGDKPRKLRVEISDDALSYKTLVDNYVAPADLYAIALGQKAMGRYVRLTELSEDNPGNWWSINEINIYNN